MKPLEFKKQASKILPVGLPSGKTIELQIKDIVFGEHEDFEKHSSVISEKLKNSELTAWEFLIENIKHCCINFNPESLKGMTLSQIRELSSTVSQALYETDDTEKKTDDEAETENIKS
jgi:hypothetical protein